MSALSDEQLIAELRHYGETDNLKISDKNREIYTKKLNHYKAREKVEKNPSKQAKQANLPQKVRLNRSQNQAKIAAHSDYYDEIDENVENYEAVNNDTLSDYVQVTNAYTSPLSNSYNQNRNSIGSENNANVARAGRENYYQRHQPDIYVLNGDSTPPKTPATDFLNYNRLKEKIEVEKTVQKHREDISDILDFQKVRTRVTNNTLNASSFLQDQSRIFPSSSNNNRQQFTSTLIEPPKPSILNRLKPNSGSNSDKEVNKRDIDIQPRRPLSQQETHPVNKQNSSKNLSLKISRWLPYIVAVVFLGLGLLYFRMRFIAGSPNVEFFSSKPNIQDVYCEDIKECGPTKALVRELIDYLRVKSGNIECKQSDNSAKFVHYDEIVNYFKKKNLIKSTEESSQKYVVPMDAVIKTVTKHPHWGIKLYDAQFQSVQHPNHVTYFMSEVSSKGFSCRVRESIQTISMNIVILLLTCFIGFAVYMISKLFLKQRQESNKAFYELVNQVVTIVERQYETSVSNDKVKPFIAISHVCDTLIDHSVRKSQKSLWENVVKYISDHESRIRVVTEFIDGEETLCWKWIVPVNLSSAASSPLSGAVKNQAQNQTSFPSSSLLTQRNSNSKMTFDNTASQSQNQNNWQSDAFAKQDKLLLSPTPCLKIRNMFDAYNLEQDPLFLIKIHNDILAKCQNVRHILHISCDKKSKEGCVYVKCSDNDAAGLAYQALNGVFYNGKLLSVKFLQHARYVERFPESANYVSPLNPIFVS